MIGPGFWHTKKRGGHHDQFYFYGWKELPLTRTASQRADHQGTKVVVVETDRVSLPFGNCVSNCVPKTTREFLQRLHDISRIRRLVVVARHRRRLLEKRNHIVHQATETLKDLHRVIMADQIVVAVVLEVKDKILLETGLLRMAVPQAKRGVVRLVGRDMKGIHVPEPLRQMVVGRLVGSLLNAKRVHLLRVTRVLAYKKRLGPHGQFLLRFLNGF